MKDPNLDWDFGAVSGNILKVSRAVSKVYTVYILSWCTTPWFRNVVHQHLGMERVDMCGVSPVRKWRRYIIARTKNKGNQGHGMSLMSFQAST